MPAQESSNLLLMGQKDQRPLNKMKRRCGASCVAQPQSCSYDTDHAALMRLIGIPSDQVGPMGDPTHLMQPSIHLQPELSALDDWLNCCLV